MTQLLAGMMLAAWTGAWAQPAATETVREAYPPPSGATRVPADAFGTWLQQRLIYPEERPIRTYRGDVVGHRGRVVDLHLVAGDLQQCADSAMRLRAEWLRSTDQPILFHATSGDRRIGCKAISPFQVPLPATGHRW